MDIHSIRIGDRVVATGEGREALARERDRVLMRDNHVRQRFQHDVCQCCGARETTGATCVCDGLDWYMLPGGGVECQAHKFARAIGDGKKTFLMGKQS